MAKQRTESARNIQAEKILPWVVLVWGLGVLPSWPAQQSVLAPVSAAQTTLTNAEKTAKGTPSTPPQSPAQWREQTAVQKTAKSTRTPARRKDMSASSRSSLLPLGARDPFKIPEVPSGNIKVSAGVNSAAASTGIMPPGPRGLVIAQLRLEGVVREQTANKMIAVVTNDTKRAYFLSENESVYNGVVSKITPDAVYFTENVLDAEGRVTSREVVKRLGPASGEGR